MLENNKNSNAEFRARMKENQDRLAEAMRNRPSLLERHTQSMAAKDAARSALQKVAGAMGST